MVPKRLTTLLAVSLLLTLATTAPAFERGGDDSRDRPGDYIVNRRGSLYDAPSATARILRELRPRTIVHVVEVKGQWYRVRSTTGKQDGWIRRSYADPYTGRGDSGGRDGGGSGERVRFRVGTFRLTTPVAVHSEPDTGSKVIATLREGATVRVVDKDRDDLWYRIESEGGKRPPGWIPTASAKRVEGDSGTRTREAPPLRRDDEYDRDDRPSRDR
jgi:SH3-like domain-containing protein